MTIDLLGEFTSGPEALAKNPPLINIAAMGNPILNIHSILALAWMLSINNCEISERMTNTPACACPARNIDF